MAERASREPPSFGVMLQRYRATAGLTQEQLATRARLSRDAITALERGKRRTPRTVTVHLLADALALDGDDREALLAAARLARAATTRGASSNLDATHPTPPPLPATLLLSAAAQPTTLIDRTEELETISRWLGSEQARLLTLTGPAGVGKTRVAVATALRLAGQFHDGVVLVDLTPIRDPSLVLAAVARGVGLVDTGSRPLLERLCDALRERSTLLVLDNFEQVLPAASALADLLANCPRLTLLVTSRVPLRLRWEWTLRIAPLPVPDLATPLPSVEELMAIPSVALFVARARARRADFALTPEHAPLVAELASQLDGLPLALELAAARLDGLPLPTIARRLGDRLRLLRWEAPDLPERQQSLEAAIGWSYELLGAPEQRLFRSLGVFVDRVALDAVTPVVAGTPGDGARASGGGDVLEGMVSLVEKSLVLPARPPESGIDEDAEPAFALLETVREYAWAQLERCGELEAARRAHAFSFLALAERADEHLRGPDRRAWVIRLEREQGNLRAAMRWLLDQNGPDMAVEREAGMRLAAALSWFWWTRGYLAEGRRWLEEALRRAPDAPPAIRIRALLGAGAMLTYQGAFDQAKTRLDDALRLAQKHGEPDEIVRALTFLGVRAVYAGDAASGLPLLREALTRGRRLDDPHLVGLTLLFLGAAVFAQGHDDQAVTLYAESLARFELAGDQLFAANLHVNLGWFAWRQGDLPGAITHIRAGVDAAVAFEDRRLLSFAAQTALAIAHDMGEPDADGDLVRQIRLLGALDALNQATGMTLMQSLMRERVAALRAHLQHDALAAEYRDGRALPFGAVADIVLALLDDASRSPGRPAARGGASLLTGRETEVLRLVAQGLSNKAIGRQLILSPSTVNYHLTGIFNKLGVNTRAQAVAVAAQRHLL